MLWEDGRRNDFDVRDLRLGYLVFYRVRELQPEEELSPQPGRRMTLEPYMVASICVEGRRVWPIVAGRPIV